MSTIELPDFTAYEINELRKRSTEGTNLSRCDYYKKCLKVVEDHEDRNITAYTDKVCRWLWGIKADLKD